MASEVGSAYISLIPSFKGGAAAIQREMGRDLTRAGKAGGDDYGKQFGAAAAAQAKSAGGDLTKGLGADAKTAGGKAGADYGKGFGDEATSRAKTAGSDLARVAGSDAKRGGQKSGEDFGKAFADEATDTVDRADIGGSIADKIKTGGVALAGLAIGGGIVAGIDAALSRGALSDKLAAQLGGGPQTKRAINVSADLFNNAWGDSVEDVNAAVGSVVTNIGGMRQASERDLRATTRSVLDIATAFDQDATSITRAADQLVRTDLAKGPREALDIITKGFQSGANEADDLLDTYAEYSTQFRKLGLDGQEATGLLSQGLQAGARDADVVADAFKEFSIRAVDGSDLTQQGFESLGLSMEDMESKLASGGQTAADATALVLDKLRAVKDPAERGKIAVKLFGTQAEDLGDALYALDPTTAVNALGKVAGAANRMGKTLNDNAASQVESFKRKMQTRFINFLGNDVIPAAQSLWKDIGPDVKRFGHSLGDAAEDIRPMVEDVLPIVADVVADAAKAFGTFATAFSKLPKPLQTAIITTALAGYGVKKVRGVLGGGGGLVPPVIPVGGGKAATTAAVGGAAATAGKTSRFGGIRGLARSFWPYLLADAGYETLVGDLWGFIPEKSQNYARHHIMGTDVTTGAFGVRQDPTARVTPKDTQTAAERSGARFEALHGLGDLLKIGTRVGPEWLGIGNSFGDLDKHLSNIAREHPDRAFKLLRGAAAEAGVPVRMLTDELPKTAGALSESGVAARFNAKQTRGAEDAGRAITNLFRTNLIPTADNLADKYNLNSKQARNLRGVIKDTTGTAEQHEKQLRRVAEKLGLDEQETRDLIKAYRDVPGKVETDAIFRTHDAANARDKFLRDTKGKFSDLGNDTYAIMVNGQSGHGRIFASGGFVSGPGGPRDDKIPARLSNGEFVVNARSTAANRDLLEDINAQKFADGGIAGRVNTKVNMNLRELRQLVNQTVKALRANGGSVPATLAWVKRQVGDPYLMGGTGPNAWDCSGFMSGITHHLMGQNPYGPRLFATSTFPTSMFARGLGTFSIGSTRDAGGGIGHMAGTLGGVNVESSGDMGVHIGRSARGARDPLFGGNIWHLKPGLIRQVVAGGRGDPAAAGGSLSAAERWIIGRESGGNVRANNPSSTAFGIGQLTSANRMAYARRLGFNVGREAGDTGTTNYSQQLAMMRAYIGDRYTTAGRAKAFWLSHGYYDQGGTLKPGYTLAYNGTGQNEYVSKEPPRRRGLQRIVLDAGSIGKLYGVIDDRIDGALDFEHTAGRGR